MKPGISRIYDYILENLLKYHPDTKITVQELKKIGDSMYIYMVNHVNEIEEMRRKAEGTK